MQKLSDTKWIEIRSIYETDPDATIRSLSDLYGVPKSTVALRKKNEGWTKDYTQDAIKLALERSGQDMDILSKKKRQVVEGLAGELYNILEKHKIAWTKVWMMFDEAVKFDESGKVIEKDFNLLKCTKISTEILLNIQKGERTSWGIELESPKIQVNTQVTNQQKNVRRLDWDSVPDDELAKIEAVLVRIDKESKPK